MKIIKKIITVIRISVLCMVAALIIRSYSSFHQQPYIPALAANTSELFTFINGDNDHSPREGELTVPSFNGTPAAIRLLNGFSPSDNPRTQELSVSDPGVLYIFRSLLIINKLPSTDITFPFHYFW